MKINIDKNLIFNSCLIHQQEVIRNVEERVNTINDDAFSHNHSASQSENHTAGKVELLDALRTELGFVTKEMEFLKSLNPLIEHTDVSPGALVTTDQLIFFIAISSEKIVIDGNDVVCISTKAPIYEAMKGLTKGASFEYNKTPYKIENIK